MEPSDQAAARPRTGRLRGFLTISATLCVLLGVAAAIGVDYSSKPEFCISCHYMQPYCDSWKRSSHSGVPCTKCHYAPGIKEGFIKKFEGLAQVTTYVTGTQGSMPSAQVDDASCLRDGCHETRVLEGKPIIFKGGGKVKVMFDHKGHLTTMRRGKKLRCTSCHSQMVQGTHMAVTTSTCSLCHFKGYSEPELVDGCSRCHPTSETKALAYGLPLVHEGKPSYGKDCFSCHRDAVRGDGDVPKGRCTSCHNQPDRVKARHDSARLHEVHITENKIDCLLCHKEITHECASENKHDVDVDVPLACVTCHGQQHNDERRIYSGTGGLGMAEPMPSRMYQRRIGCNACHRTPNPERDGFPLATAPDCMRCHGTGISETVQGWSNLLAATMVNARDRVKRLDAEIEKTADPKAQAAARALKSKAEANIRLVKRGRGLHNIDYALALLDRSVQFCNEAREKIGNRTRFEAARPKQRIESDCYNTCHVGIEEKTVRVFDVEMPHGKHLIKAGLYCSTCHEETRYPKNNHGAVSVTPKQCLSCHHSGGKKSVRKACEKCHENQRRMYAGTGGNGLDDSPNIMFAEVACSKCHTSVNRDPSLKAIRNECASCHEGNRGYPDELAKWTAEPKEELNRATDLLKQVKELLLYADPGSAKARGTRKKIGLAEQNIHLVRTGGPVHNPEYARNLLEAAAKILEETMTALKSEEDE